MLVKLFFQQLNLQLRILPKYRIFQCFFFNNIRYNFVTPLTSIVVLKDKDRKEIEKKLKEDEEKARLAKLTTTTVAPTTVASKQTQAMKTNNQYTQPSTVNPTVYPNYGGVYRDPHVVLPIKPGVNVCFNWNGKDEEVFLFRILCTNYMSFILLIYLILKISMFVYIYIF